MNVTELMKLIGETDEKYIQSALKTGEFADDYATSENMPKDVKESVTEA